MSIAHLLNTVIHGDCLEVMREMPDGCVDLVLTDPPYGIGEANGKNISRGCIATSRDYGKENWDSQPPTPSFFAECFRISKNQVFFGGNFFNLPPSSCWLVWDKENGDTDFADCELAWTSFPSAVRKFKWRWQGMLQQNMKDKDERIHPTQKPVALGIWILQKYSKPTDIIFDPMAGSGSFLVAAARLGRPWFGCDNHLPYVEMARNRIKLECAQLSMFTAR